MRKPVFGSSDQLRHKPACTVTEAGWKLEISDLRRREIVLCSKNVLISFSYCEADLRLCFRLGKNPVFSRWGSNVKMPTIVGILTFISRLNYRFGDLNLKFQFILAIFSFMSSFNLCSAELNMKKVL